ncbi:hypothetical protein JW906_10385 [bacterium]|nr:hypothetical protein [bacterium]
MIHGRSTIPSWAAFCFCLVLFNAPLFPADFIVVNTADDGPGSLRNAILEANSNPGPDAILFRIPKSDPGYHAGTGVFSIKPLTPLTAISDSGLMIDGRSQREFLGEDCNPSGPEIELDGSSCAWGSGLYIQTNEVQVFHLIINRFNQMGVYLAGTERCIIAGCYIGVDGNGLQHRGNLYGIFMDDTSRYNAIVPLDTLPNIIGGNPWGGIKITYGSCHNIVSSNYIGLNRTGTDTVGNGLRGGYAGVEIEEGSHHNEINGNMIFGNRKGIEIWDAYENTVINNCIGTDRTWTLKLGNVDSGIRILSYRIHSTKNLIIENFIGHHPFSGVYLDGENTYENTLSRNCISANLYSGITLAGFSNAGISAPTLLSATPEQVLGTASPSSVIEVFSDASSQGMQYLGSTVTDASGSFAFNLSGLSPVGNITATATDIAGNTSIFSAPVIVNTVIAREDPIPGLFGLERNFPNPFNPETRIRFTIPEYGPVKIMIADVQGRLIETVLDRQMHAGTHQIRWAPKGISGGVYFCCLKMGGREQSIKMVYIK